MKAEYKIKVFTGIRPTGDLTVANYIGAIKPVIKLQDEGLMPMVFIADLHALTDNEPSFVEKFVNEVAIDYLALGLDPNRAIIYKQSSIDYQIYSLTNTFARLVTVAELLRVPTLKDKLKGNASPETANSLLLLYPVMMAADILINRAEKIPVGEDQISHLEVVRELARRFNSRYGEVFLMPKAFQTNSYRILSLRGHGKMSKSSPDGAIFLTDNPKDAVKKIKKAETAIEGKTSDNLNSHIILAKNLSNEKTEHDEIDEIIKEHLNGKKVMGDFKNIFAKIVERFLLQFQERRKQFAGNIDFVNEVLSNGAKIATINADETMILVKDKLYTQKG